MPEIDLLEVCGNEKIKMCRDGQGNLFQWNGEGWQPYLFNEIYRGYFPSCRFTAVGYYGAQFYAAGVDEQDRTHLFATGSGSVWVEQNLTATDPLGRKTELRGSVVKMLCSRNPFQIHLLTAGKQLASVPDCPKCVRIYPLEDLPADGWIEDSSIHIQWDSGGEKVIPLSDVTGFRVSWSYAAQLMQAHSAVVADLRTPEEYRRGHFPRSASIPEEQVADWLETQSKDAYILFLCKYGVQADNSAKYARRIGFSHVYSMGGTEPFAHID